MGAAADRSALALPACLIIMDGFGMDEPGPGNAIAQAATPVLDELLAARPHTLLDASGEAVGLPEGQMGNSEVADTLAAAIDAGEADVYIVNFANCDMVGHTGVIPAAVAAVEAVDAGLGKVLAAMERAGGVTLVTADHGNADKMLADDGTPHTAHTTAPVPLVLVDATGRGRSLQGRRGRLADIAPTLLEMVGLPVPPEMTGMSLLA